MALKDLKDVTYYDLNNEINIPVNGQIPLNKDKEALAAFLTENVEPNTMKFDSLRERFDYLLDNNYIERDFFEKYDFSFVEKLYDYLNAQDFHFKTFMAAYKFYAQYTLRTNDNQQYLEGFIDRVAMNALFFADGDEQLAMDLADEIVHQRYQPATPSFLYTPLCNCHVLVVASVLTSQIYVRPARQSKVSPMLHPVLFPL